jgi:hypothetical protein
MSYHSARDNAHFGGLFTAQEVSANVNAPSQSFDRLSCLFVLPQPRQRAAEDCNRTKTLLPSSLSLLPRLTELLICQFPIL